MHKIETLCLRLVVGELTNNSFIEIQLLFNPHQKSRKIIPKGIKKLVNVNLLTSACRMFLSIVASGEKYFENKS